MLRTSQASHWHNPSANCWAQRVPCHDCHFAAGLNQTREPTHILTCMRKLHERPTADQTPAGLQGTGLLALVSGVAHAMLIMTRPVLLQVSGTSNPDEVLTAMRELPESTARDQDHLVPLVAEVVMLSKHGTLNITTSLYGLVTHSKSDAACEPSCHCSFIRCV